MYVLLLKYRNKIAIRLFTDKVQAYLASEFYNTFTTMSAEVVLLPITEKTVFQGDSIIFEESTSLQLDAEFMED